MVGGACPIALGCGVYGGAHSIKPPALVFEVISNDE